MAHQLSATFLSVAVALYSIGSTPAVNVGISDQPDVLSSFNATNSMQLYRMFSNRTVTFKSIMVPTGRTGADINDFVRSLNAGSFDLVIGTFNELLSSACTSLGVPFYSLSEMTLDPLLTSASFVSGSTTLFVNTLMDELILASINFTITVAKRNTIVMLTDDIGAKLNTAFVRNISYTFRISQVDSNMTSEIRQILYQYTTLSAVEDTVYLIASTTPGYASNILKEAVYLSMLTPNAFWIITNLFLNPAEITQFYATRATIITFRLPNPNITNSAQLSVGLAVDSIQHFIASSAYNATNTSSIMQKIFFTTIDGTVSKTHFNSTDRRQDRFAANLMATDPSSSSSLLLYSTWNESVADSILASRTQAVLQLPTLRIAGTLVDPFVMKTSGGFTGFSVSLLQKISANIFTYDINDITKYPTQDVLQSVRLGLADIGANLVDASLLIDNSREIIPSEIPILTSGVASLGKSAIKEIDFLSPLYPLTWNCWFAIILALIILSITLYLTDKISPNDYKRPKYTIASAAFFVYSSFVMSKLKASAVKPSSRIFILILWFASLMYCTTYGTNFFFLLVRTNPNLPFANLSSFINDNSNNYYPIMIKNSAEYRLLQSSNDSVYKKIISAVTPQSTNSPSRLYSTIAEAISIIKNTTVPNQKKPILIGDELILTYYAARDCELKSAGKNELSRSLHLIFNRNLSASLISKINKRIQQLSDRGELEQLKNTFWAVILCSASENLITYSELSPITLDQVAGIFMVLAAAFVLSFVVVALEYIFHAFGLHVQRFQADPKLQFNHSYQVVVTGINPEGVFVKLHGETEFIPNNMLSPDASKDMTASDLQIQYGSVIEIAFLGNDPTNGNRIFHRR